MKHVSKPSNFSVSHSKNILQNIQDKSYVNICNLHVYVLFLPYRNNGIAALTFRQDRILPKVPKVLTAEGFLNGQDDNEIMRGNKGGP